jgi:hypothetical protein
MHPHAAQTLTESQLRQLQWVLPTPFSAQLCAFFMRVEAPGAKLRVSVNGVEHWLGVFDIERMVDEALRCPQATLARLPRLLPFAGCGRRRAALYLVDVLDLQVWCAQPGREPETLGLTIEELWSSAVFEPRVVVRRRLPARHEKTSSRQTRVSVSGRQRVDLPCSRTLSLFPI